MVFVNMLPGAVAEGLIWGLMAIGVYISYKVLDIADLTVDGSICTGGCVCAVGISGRCAVWYLNGSSAYCIGDSIDSGWYFNAVDVVFHQSDNSGWQESDDD